MSSGVKGLDDKAEGEIAVWARGQDAEKLAALKNKIAPKPITPEGIEDRSSNDHSHGR